MSSFNTYYFYVSDELRRVLGQASHPATHYKLVRTYDNDDTTEDSSPSAAPELVGDDKKKLTSPNVSSDSPLQQDQSSTSTSRQGVFYFLGGEEGLRGVEK
jgi:hypothetical protein